MPYKSDPAGSWKAVYTLEKGLKHHHVQNRTVWMRKANGERAKMDEENAEVFAEHFCKVFYVNKERPKAQSSDSKSPYMMMTVLFCSNPAKT
eukprot:13138880-Ditylum_brightwellii.AAC.1